jgi:predicted AlkP superfamily phosphohydrolase/phosphomutase
MTERSRAVSARNNAAVPRVAGVWPRMLLGAVTGAALAFSLLTPGCSSDYRLSKRTREKRLLIIGIDGMDARLTQQMMDEGRLPNFAQLANDGGFSKLGTSIPPQSPVAWSNFISGSDPGTHQLYDFVHRDPRPADPDQAVVPFLSTSVTEPKAGFLSKLFPHGISSGKWTVPVSSSETELLRRGDAWWNHLTAAGVDTTVYYVPSNYPPAEAPGPGEWRCIAGMGTPDVLGTYGEFTLFTRNAPLAGRTVGGGRFVHLDVIDDHATAVLEGPDNFLRTPDRYGRLPKMTVPIELVRDPSAAVVSVTIGDEKRLLIEGEWSDWIPIRFETGLPASEVVSVGVPTSVPGMIRLHVRHVRPLELYVSPINIDPRDPATPISYPEDFAAQIAHTCGPYYTAGIPEDAKALRCGALDEDEFLQHVDLICQERDCQYWHALEHFDHGCLFFYFGHTDQVSHMFWRDRDPQHPGRRPEQGDKYAHVIEDTYIGMDKILGETRKRLRKGDTLIVLSDHGFTTFRRGFNLNRWLVDNHYMAVLAPAGDRRELDFSDVDWQHTKAYGLGLNSLYINLRGHEKWGIVEPADREALVREICEKLLTVRDTDGTQVIFRVDRPDQCYPGADPMIAPDILVGYAENYRASWSTVLGGIPPALIEDNTDRWSGDHLIAPNIVPGVLFSNRRITAKEPSLSDLAPSILHVYGIPTPATMKGHNVLAEAER